MTVVDASDSNALKVTAEQYLPGSAVSSRRIDSSLRVVLSESIQWPEGVKWWVEWKPSFNTDPNARIAAFDALEDANEKIIRATPVESFFPAGKRKLPDGSLVDLSYRCSDFYVSNVPERPGVLTIATVDLANPSAGAARTSIFGEPGIVYATAQHLRRLMPFASVAALLDFARAKPIRTVQPEVIESPTGIRPFLRPDLIDAW